MVKELFDDLKETLSLTLVAGEGGLYKYVENHRIQKPGLALAGFLQHVHTERVQVFGETEISYLNHIGDAEAKKRIREFLALGVACVVVTKGLEVPSYVKKEADQHEVAVFVSPKVSSECIDRLTDYLEDKLASEQSIHGVLVDVFGVGVLIVGESGVGKSECALDLVHRGHRLVADDLVIVKRRRGILWGTSPIRIQHLMEVRGLGIVDVRDLFGVSSIRDRKRIDLIVELVRFDKFSTIERVGFAQKTKELLGVKVPYIALPVSPGRNITLLVEIAAKLFLLKGAVHSQQVLDTLLFSEGIDGKGVE
ncbi:HPr kinase/phosphorylase [Thermosulfidibacter takaii ABI70S6]|uniref:HPr kinase/phosphorylase n=1 Tax=Thermosulfidibacter takaii (strain DSM 17441 / JCM 13301 / NBRC 103674 / ABI70S6) TaxID=1298851 RepID=A0A0S3QSF3_THET7|nr:HPr kinase/phosphorylase [Thermosulfidibacter takaii ABI70S6]